MIGPDLPPHLRKRAASAEQTADAEDSDGEYGPALPPGRAGDVAATNASDQVQDDNDDEEAYGPAPPPGPRPSVSPSSAQPAAGGSNEREADGDDDDDDDEVYGPQAPAARGSAQPLNEAAQWDQLRAEDEVLAKARRANEDAADNGRKRAREEWMLVPPEAKATGSGNKFRARAAQATDMSWAKTPGKGVPAVASRPETRAPARKETEADDDTERNIQTFDEIRRHQRPLMEVHAGQKQKRSGSGSEGQPRTGPLVWDRERDLVDNRKRVDAKDYMKTVGKLNDRFSGTSRKFL